MRTVKLNIVFSLIVFLIIGCSAGEVKEPKDLSAKEIYNQAKEALSKEDYQTAIEKFETLEARYPFGRYAEQAQLETAYAYYKFGEADSALAAAERFIRTHPRHPNVDYAFYLKGLANFLRGISFFDRYLPLDLSKRDPQAMGDSFQNFSDLITRFPDSRYANDARQRMIYLRNQLAKHELNIADYYMRREAYVAAANRAQFIIKHYQTTDSNEAALEIMIKAYAKLKLPTLQNDAMRVLQENYPNNALVQAQ